MGRRFLRLCALTFTVRHRGGAKRSLHSHELDPRPNFALCTVSTRAGGFPSQNSLSVKKRFKRVHGRGYSVGICGASGPIRAQDRAKETMQLRSRAGRLRWHGLGGLSILMVIASSSGCVHVRPYQRERLTHPTMTTVDWGGAGETHARAVREGAIGGGSAGEAGCGCN